MIVLRLSAIRSSLCKSLVEYIMDWMGLMSYGYWLLASCSGCILKVLPSVLGGLCLGYARGWNSFWILLFGN